MINHLPPFSALLAFDAAAHTGSFSKAAAQLNVTQPAISRRISTLEESLGILLFDRSTKPNTLTEAGRHLQIALRSSLDRLEVAIADIRAYSSKNIITLSCIPGFASFWLLPRLNELNAAFPDYEFRILTTDGTLNWAEVDLRIEFGDGFSPNNVTRKVLGEEAYAVCHPSLATQGKHMSLKEIAKLNLLHLRDNYDRWYSWQSWFTALGHQPENRHGTIEFDNYSLLVSAALAGQGAALCWTGLMDSFIESGALIRISKESVTSDRGYHIFHPATLSTDAPAYLVAKWLETHKIGAPNSAFG